MKKKNLALILAVVMALLTMMAGCGDSGGNDSSSDTSTTETDATETDATETGTDATGTDTGAEDTTAAPTGQGGPNALADGNTDLENIAFFDPNFDYASNKKFKIKYLTMTSGPLYDDMGKAVEHWAGLMNLQYDGQWSGNNDNEQYLNYLQTCIDQGYDGIIMDPDVTIYTAIVEKMNANPQVQWMAAMAPVRDINSSENPQPLLRPYVGHEHYRMGTYMTDKLVEHAQTAWPDVEMKDIGVCMVDYAVVEPLHDRERGARDKWNELYPDLADNFFTVDGSSSDQSSDTARNVVMPLVSTNNQFSHWLVAAVHDDYAIGAAAALDSLGLTDTSCVVTIGGSGLVKQMDAGQETAWKYAFYTSQAVYMEPIVGALYAFMAGYATPENIWPQWVNENDHGADPHRYPMYMLPAFWIDKDNYKEYLAWTDIYAQSNLYPDYPRDGIDRDLFSTIAAKPDYYN